LDDARLLRRPLVSPLAPATVIRGPQAARWRWLQLDDDRDRAEFQRWWEQSVYRRPHDHLGFLALVRPQNYAPTAIVYEHNADARICYPFFQCELNRLPEFADIGCRLKHLVSPYGYGGALYEGADEYREEASASFEILLNAELKERQFVTEFVREDLFSDRLALRSNGEIEQQPNVLVRLDRTQNEIWSTYKHSVRGNINKAVKQGLWVSFDPEARQLDSFLRIYYETMQRRNASGNFYFSKDRFEHLCVTLGAAGKTMFVHVHDGQEVISSELLLLSGDTIYSFLGGSLAASFPKRPNNLLKHEVILWGRANGFKWLVLGGGVAPGDELLRFKQSFDPNHVMPFTVRRVIHDDDAYALLVRTRNQYEYAQGRHWQPRPGFFPEYLSSHDNERPTLVTQECR
jgi:hypothetical protein